MLTPRETLAKYNLESDVKSVMERMEKADYITTAHQIFQSLEHTSHLDNGCRVLDKDSCDIYHEIMEADHALLCEMAEKGERENKLLELYRQFFKETNISIDLDDCDIDDISSTFEYVNIDVDKADVDTVKKIYELEKDINGGSIEMNTKIKELQTLCDFYHLDLRVQYYEDHEVCFKGINDSEQEVFNIAVWYPKKKEKRIFYIELNSCYEEWRGGQFTKEDMLLFLSIDDLSDEELNIKEIIKEVSK